MKRLTMPLSLYNVTLSHCQSIVRESLEQFASQGAVQFVPIGSYAGHLPGSVEPDFVIQDSVVFHMWYYSPKKFEP